MSLVGADSSPLGSSINFQGIKAPAQLQPKINKNKVPIKGSQGRYSLSPNWLTAISWVNSTTDSIKFCQLSGICFIFVVPKNEKRRIIKITNQLTRKTCP